MDKKEAKKSIEDLKEKFLGKTEEISDLLTEDYKHITDESENLFKKVKVSIDKNGKTIVDDIGKQG